MPAARAASKELAAIPYGMPSATIAAASAPMAWSKQPDTCDGLAPPSHVVRLAPAVSRASPIVLPFSWKMRTCAVSGMW